MSDRAEGTFVRLRYSLAEDRPSQSTHHTLSLSRITALCYNVKHARLLFQLWLHCNSRHSFNASQLSYTSRFKVPCEAIVKVHGVFPSCRGFTASSQRFRFH